MEVTEDKPRETEEKPKPSPLEYRCPYCHAWHLTSKNTQPGERHG